MNRPVYHWVHRAFALCACIVPAFLIAGSFLAPTLNFFSYPDGEAFYGVLSKICHQDFSRVLYILGHPHGLCARCLGGYIGVLASVMVVLLQHGKSRDDFVSIYAIGSTVLILAIVDALAKFGDTNIYRIASGFFGGSGFGCMLAALYTLVFRGRLYVQKKY